MREVVFRLEAERPGHLEARAETLPIRMTAMTLEELQHEAREALIAPMGAAHCTVRVRVRRSSSAAMSAIPLFDGRHRVQVCRPWWRLWG